MKIKNVVITDVDIAMASAYGLGLLGKIALNDGISAESIKVSLSNNANIEISRWLSAFFKAVGVNSLQELIGKAVRLKCDGAELRIGHIIWNRWFDPYGLKVDLSADAEIDNQGQDREGEKNG